MKNEKEKKLRYIGCMRSKTPVYEKELRKRELSREFTM